MQSSLLIKNPKKNWSGFLFSLPVLLFGYALIAVVAHLESPATSFLAFLAITAIQVYLFNSLYIKKANRRELPFVV
ncbi:MAG: hypothetical protein CSB48_11130 [Proteobacteria bacterium]|nr:MAG: hypothetical protein CSB48_11130 [Pseudomonadota bacterium]